MVYCNIIEQVVHKMLVSTLIQAGTRTIDIEFTTLSSTNHIEMNPSDAGFQDRYIVQEIIKEMAENRQFDTKGKRGFKGEELASFLYGWVHAVS